jgi:hypothetical protein
LTFATASAWMETPCFAALAADRWLSSIGRMAGSPAGQRSGACWRIATDRVMAAPLSTRHVTVPNSACSTSAVTGQGLRQGEPRPADPDSQGPSVLLTGPGCFNRRHTLIAGTRPASSKTPQAQVTGAHARRRGMHGILRRPRPAHADPCRVWPFVSGAASNQPRAEQRETPGQRGAARLGVGPFRG